MSATAGTTRSLSQRLEGRGFCFDRIERHSRREITFYRGRARIDLLYQNDEIGADLGIFTPITPEIFNALMDNLQNTS